MRRDVEPAPRRIRSRRCEHAASRNCAANGRIALIRGTLEVDSLAQAVAPTALGSWLLSFDGALSADN